MASENVLVVCHYDGMISDDSSNCLDYVGGRSKLMRISKPSTFAQLKRKIYSIAKINPSEYNLKIVCKVLMTAQVFTNVEIADDEDTELMLGLYPTNPSVCLFVEKQAIIHNEASLPPQQGVFSRMLDMDNDSTGFLSPQAPQQGPSNVNEQSESEESDDEANASIRETSIQCALDDDDDNDQWVHEAVANNDFVDDEDPHPDEVIDEGMMFSSKTELVQAISNWSLRRCVAFRTVKSTTTKYTVVCANTTVSSSSQQCPWRLHASVSRKWRDSNRFTVKKYTPEHICRNSGRDLESRQVTANFICQCILPLLKKRLDMTPAVIQDHVKLAYLRDITYYKAWDARRKALCKLFGDWETSYHTLPQYIEAIQRSNPDTIYSIASEQLNENQALFRGLFWAFGPSIEGFAKCRPVLSIDGTHLYGKYKGCLLVATGIDADSGLYPLCFAVVSAETTDNWEWFFTCIRYFIPSVRRRQITWISDRMKGLPRALAEGWREPHFHRYCLRHIRANFKIRFKDEALQNMLYIAGNSNDHLVYKEYMAKIKEKCPAADSWIESSLGPENEDRWALCKDGGRRYCIMTTNCSDNFNGVLKGARALPIQSIVARTFYSLNKYFFTRREKSATWESKFCPTTERILGERVNESRYGALNRYSYDTWEVYDRKGFAYSLKLNDDECEGSCNIPLLHKIPCVHAIKACSRSDGGANRDFERYCSQWYTTDNYRQAYAPIFRPIPDSRYWMQCQGPKLLPPAEKRDKGRPRSTRLKGAMDEHDHEGGKGN